MFPHACTFHCLYCQNWHFRQHTFDPAYEPVERLAEAVDEKTACICHFGGDPSPLLPFLLRASRLARERSPGRILRICWETNGAMAKPMLREMADTAMESGGCIFSTSLQAVPYQSGISRLPMEITGSRA